MEMFLSPDSKLLLLLIHCPNSACSHEALWPLTLQGAAKKQSASRPRPRDGSDEEAPAEPRNQQRKAKENLLAIHSESQRLVRGEK